MDREGNHILAKNITINLLIILILSLITIVVMMIMMVNVIK